MFRQWNDGVDIFDTATECNEEVDIFETATECNEELQSWTKYMWKMLNISTQKKHHKRMKTTAYDLSSRSKSFGLGCSLRELQFFACADRLDQNRALSVC